MTESIEVGEPLTWAPEGDATLGGFLVDVASRFADRTALVTESGRWTYRELLGEAMAVARGLLAQGVAAGTAVGVLMPNGIDWIAAAFGAALIGAVPIMLNVFSSVPEQEVALTMMAAPVLLMSSHSGERSLIDPLVAANPKLVHGESPAGEDDKLPSLEQVFCWGAGNAGARVGTSAELLASGADVGDDEVTRSRASVSVDDDALV